MHRNYKLQNRLLNYNIILNDVMTNDWMKSLCGSFQSKINQYKLL